MQTVSTKTNNFHSYKEQLAEMQCVSKYNWTKHISSKLAMDNEMSRLSTYSKFNLCYPVSPLRLAEAGFYYEGNGDEVVCFMCKFKHKSWRKCDNPFQVHRELSPECEFIKHHPKIVTMDQQNIEESRVRASDVGIQNNSVPASGAVALPNAGSPCSSVSNNIVSQQTTRSQERSAVNQRRSDMVGVSESSGGVGIHNATTFSPHSNMGYTSQSFNNNVMNSSNAASTQTACARMNQVPIQNMGISTARPRYSSYAIVSVRESSYRNWSPSLIQQPHELAKAGFFYEGRSDHVRCFFCGGGLKDWEPEDDPWVEHARWFPKCVYVRQCKGEQFVSGVLAGVNDLIHNNQLSVGNIEIKQEEDPAVLSVVEMGYRPELVRKIYLRLKRSKGAQHISADLLLQAVWDMEDSGIENDDVTEGDLTETPVCNRLPANHVNDNTSFDNRTTDECHLSKDDESEIQEENRALKEMKACKICLDEDATIVFLPCGHLVSCASCAPALTKCPICRGYIKGTVKAILS